MTQRFSPRQAHDHAMARLGFVTDDAFLIESAANIEKRRVSIEWRHLLA